LRALFGVEKVVDMNKEPYISRVEHRSGKSGFWWVRFHAGTSDESKNSKQKHIAQCAFTDHEYGGKTKALRAAKIWRDATAIGLGKNPKKIERPSCSKGKARKSYPTNTGVIGVTLGTRPRKTGTYHFYSASWMETIDGCRRSRTVVFGFDSTDPHDKQKAFKYAVRERKRKVKQHYTAKAPS
jgi:hypothetical protein